MKKFLVLIIILFLIFFIIYYPKSNSEKLSINLSQDSNSFHLYNNKLGPGSFGYFTIFIKSNNSLSFVIKNKSSNIPKYFLLYINNFSVDISKKNTILYTGNTSSTQKLYFYWKLPSSFQFSISYSQLIININFVFERSPS